jgi:hypothetical protein
LSTASQLGQRIEPTEVENLANAARAANYPAGAAQVYAAFAHKDLHDDFGRSPIPDQTGEINALRAAGQYQPTIMAAAAKYGVDPALLGRQLHQESGFNPNAVSSAGAQGIAQFMPATAARYGVNPRDPASSIEGQAHYMSDLSRQFGGNTGLALAGYNWGEGNVAKWLASGGNPAAMPAETRNYVQSITGQKIEDWTAGKTPAIDHGGVVGPGVQSWLLANRQATLEDSVSKEWKQTWTDWANGKGGAPPPDRVNDLIAGARASGNIDLLEKINQGAALFDYADRIKQLPIAQQGAAETELRRRIAMGQPPFAGAELVEKQLAARTAAIQKGVEDDPVATTVANFPDKLKTPAPLDFTDPGKLVQGLQMRAQIAQVGAHNWQTGPLSALDSQDVVQAKAALQNPDPRVKAGIYGAIAQLPDDVRGATLRKLGGNEPDGKAEASAGSMMATAPDIAASIFRGQSIMSSKDGKRFDPTTEDEGRRGYFTDLDKTLPMTMFSQQDRTQPDGDYATMATMVKARYADLQSQKGDPRYNQATLQKAVTDVTGGILTHNGQDLIAPARGMTQPQFDNVIRGITDDDLKGVTTLSGRQITPDFLRNQAQLESRGQGQYWVRIGSAYAMRYAGTESPSPFVLDLKGRAGAPTPGSAMSAQTIP